jgi:2-oxo-4-hydroxy-4-carboxy-5-ureidoimidazoline decarboxylase
MAKLSDLNALDRAAFVASLGHVFEHSPWVADRAWPARPFSSLEHLLAQMTGVVARASREEQLGLIRAHPELVGRLAPAPLSAQSASEQSRAGLDAASEAELAELARLNGEYRAKFGFPFILAVRGLGRAQIAQHLSARITHSPDQEFAECLAQIGRIARFRLDDLLGRE